MAKDMFVKEKNPVLDLEKKRISEMVDKAFLDAENEEIFGLYDIVYFVTGGPAMAITEFVGETRCTCKWFTANDVLMVHNFDLASLTHGEDLED